MTTRLSRLGVLAIAGTACTALLLSTAGIADADTTPSPAATGSAAPAARLATIQALAKTAIADRQAALSKTIPAVTANAVITATDKATLLTTLNGDVNGLAALATKIAADTTADAAETDYKTIFTSYRVYALALPQVRYAEAVDDITSGVLPKLTNAQTTLAGLLSGADSGKNTAAVQAAMADLGKQIAAITSATNGLSATVLALTPAQYDANHAVLSQPRATLAQAGADVKTATADIATVVKALQ